MGPLQLAPRRLSTVLIALLATAIGVATQAGQIPSGPNKSSLSTTNQKIDSQLLIEIEKRERPSSRPSLKTIVRIDRQGRAFVDLRADVTPSFLKTVRSAGGVVVSSSVEYHSIIAWVPLAKIKSLAERQDVRAIMPAAEATTNRGP